MRCNYNLENRTVTNNENLAVGGGVNDAGTQNGVVDTPGVTLRVADRAGKDISSAKVGDPLALRSESQHFGVQITGVELFIGSKVQCMTQEITPPRPCRIVTLVAIQMQKKCQQKFHRKRHPKYHRTHG